MQISIYGVLSLPHHLQCRAVRGTASPHGVCLSATSPPGPKSPRKAQKGPGRGPPSASKHRNRANPPSLQLQRHRLGHPQRHQVGLSTGLPRRWGFGSLSLAGDARICVAIRLWVVVGEIHQMDTWTALRRGFCSSSYQVTACPLMEAHQRRPTVRAKGTEPRQPRVRSALVEPT